MGREAFMVHLDPRFLLGMRRLREDLIISIGSVLCVLLVFGGAFYLQATNEAAAFNRLTTGPKVTVWDAVWLDLRVEAR